jgi:hypothetical protein
MKGGMKIGIAASCSSSPDHGTLVRTRHQARSTPISAATSMVPMETTKVFHIAIQ